MEPPYAPVDRSETGEKKKSQYSIESQRLQCGAEGKKISFEGVTVESMICCMSVFLWLLILSILIIVFYITCAVGAGSNQAFNACKILAAILTLLYAVVLQMRHRIVAWILFFLWVIALIVDICFIVMLIIAFVKGNAKFVQFLVGMIALNISVLLDGFLSYIYLRLCSYKH